MDSLKERVARGVALLDEHDPGWWRDDHRARIDLEKLDLESSCLCVLGQLHPRSADPYARGLSLLRLRVWWEDWRRRPSDVDHGFNAKMMAEYIPLANEWRRVISERRSG